ncbi:MAG: EAL domain-containing protein [Gammaproteobacteria bacterium]
MHNTDVHNLLPAVLPASDDAAATALRCGDSEHMRLDRLRLLYEQLPGAIVGSMFAAALLGGLLLGLDPDLPVLPWLIAMTVLTLARMLQALHYRHSSIEVATARRWCAAYTLANLAAGCAWAAVLAVPAFDDPRQTVITLVVLGGIMAAGCVLYAASLRALGAFITPISAMLLYVVNTHPALDALTLLVPAYVLMLASGALRVARAVTAVLRVREENATLLRELRRERDRAVDLNTGLEARIRARTNDLSAANAQLQREIAARDAVQRKLTHQAAHDTLTGLCNRGEFERRLQALVADQAARTRPHALCYIDLDQFKLVNDTCGHMAGDALLRRLGRELARHVRRDDVLARLGGDEFGILMHDTALNDSMALVERLREAIEAFSFRWEARTFKISASFGVTIIKDDGATMHDLLRDADSACYMAKDRGRNRVHVHVDDDATMARRRDQMSWVGRLEAALEEGRLRLARQPIVASDDRSVHHWEVLLRLEDEDGDIVLPGRFLPAAERYGLMPRIDRYVVDRVLAHVEAVDRGDSIYAVNLSAASLGDERFVRFLREVIAASGCADRLCFEITETFAIANLREVTDMVADLRALGARFSLDDFGTGMASFDYLRSLPVDYLKIDGSFIRDIDSNPFSHAVVRAANDIAHLMGMRTVAEFVETAPVIALLRDLGIDYLQGYAFGKPEFFMDEATAGGHLQTQRLMVG